MISLLSGSSWKKTIFVSNTADPCRCGLSPHLQTSPVADVGAVYDRKSAHRAHLQSSRAVDVGAVYDRMSARRAHLHGETYSDARVTSWI